MQHRSIWIGYDPRETEAFLVARESIRRHLTQPIPIFGVVLDVLKARKLYTRPTERRGNQLWDVISDAPKATEFAISRFLVPHIARTTGLALFMDCDMLVRTSISRLFDKCDPKMALTCVKHNHKPINLRKMDDQEQTRYARKNWSSVMVFNLDHPSNKALTPDLVNTVPGRDLHRFCWLKDDEIGELGPEWNFLVGHTDPKVIPNIVHYTSGGPWLDGYRDAPFADEWRASLTREVRAA